MNGTLKALPVVAEPEGRAAEAYRSLLVTLLMMEADAPARVLGVASPGREASRVAVASNLAALFALGGAQCLLVETDIRRPVVHTIFGASASPGLVDCLQGQAPDSLVRPSALQGLHLLPAGTSLQGVPNLAGFQKVSDAMSSLFSRFDRVVVVLPPLLAASEALVCAGWTDGILLVLEAFETRRDLARQAKALLDIANLRVLGAVLANAADSQTPLRY